MRRVIALAAPVPHHLGVLAAELDARYHELRPGDVVEPTATVEPGPFTSTRLPPPPPRLPSARPPRLCCEVVRRMTGSSTQPLLLAITGAMIESRPDEAWTEWLVPSLRAGHGRALRQQQV